jgi:site-specific DNA-methyltransferase (adenine-specific)
MIINGDCYELLKTIESKSVNLVIVDPPYLISRESNFKTHSDTADKDLVTKYNFSIDFGQWDKEDLNLDLLFSEWYRVLKPGGSLIIFFDIWKCEQLKLFAEKYKFKQPRVGQWQKTNPVPVNSGLNYLSNAIEYFFTFVKGKNPTFNSKYDNGVYKFPICHGNERTKHPTQKPVSLIKALIEKHSNIDDVILDNFAGSGTTAHACILTERKFIMIEKDEAYFNIMKNRLENLSTNYIS